MSVQFGAELRHSSCNGWAICFSAAVPHPVSQLASGHICGARTCVVCAQFSEVVPVLWSWFSGAVLGISPLPRGIQRLTLA